MHEISINEAVSQGFGSRASIYRSINNGSLSVKKSANNKVRIDVAELIRVFGEPSPHETSDDTNLKTERQSSIWVENAVLKERIEGLMNERNFLRDELSESKNREKRFMDQIDSQTKLLTEIKTSGSIWDWFKRK